MSRDAEPDASQPPIVACVEDDAAVREALEGLLFAFGYTPAMYASAEAFLSSAMLPRVACLILDVQLGGMSGIELQRRLARISPPIPTIVITAFGEDRTREQALGLGAIAFLRKPIAQEDLLASVEAALRQRSKQ